MQTEQTFHPKVAVCVWGGGGVQQLQMLCSHSQLPKSFFLLSYHMAARGCCVLCPASRGSNQEYLPTPSWSFGAQGIERKLSSNSRVFKCSLVRWLSQVNRVAPCKGSHNTRPYYKVYQMYLFPTEAQTATSRTVTKTLSKFCIVNVHICKHFSMNHIHCNIPPCKAPLEKSQSMVVL